MYSVPKKIIKRLSASPLCLWRFAENLPFHNLFEILGNLLPHIDYRAIDFMYLCRCDRIFVASLAELELHIVQSSGYIQAQFERNGGFQDGDVIVELHIQPLCAAYRRSVTVH